MKTRIALAALILAFGTVSLAQAQQAGGDTRRKTIAATFPEKGRIRLVMTGTTAAPKANGAAEVRRLRGLTQVEIELDDMVPAYLLGADYTTYVLWAITPEGQSENLGEFRLAGSRSKLRATTRFQTISLIVTAEPHFAVQRPSRRVVLENVPPNGPGVAVQTADVFFTGDSGRYYSNQSLPDAVGKEYAKQPTELLGARRAIEIAVLAQAEKYAVRDLSSARDTFSQAEQAYAAADRENAALLGRRAILQAERARELSEERSAAAERRARELESAKTLADVESRSREALDRIDDLESQLKVSEASRTRAEEEAERAHEESATLRVQNRALQGQIDQLTDQFTQLQDHVAQMERTHQADAQAAERDQAYRGLTDMMRPVASVQSDARGFKVVLVDSLFVSQKATLAPTAAAKLNPIAALLIAHPSVQFLIDGYTDDKMTPDAAMTLSEARARAVGDFLVAAGVSQERFKTAGYGPSNPITTNKTLKGRSANRRVELVALKP